MNSNYQLNLQNNDMNQETFCERFPENFPDAVGIIESLHHSTSPSADSEVTAELNSMVSMADEMCSYKIESSV